MKINPKPNIVQVEPLKNIRTKADIVYDEGEEDKDLVIGEIIATNINNPDSDYSIGDIIIYGRYAAYPLNIKGTKMYLLSMEDILGTIEGVEKDV